MDQKIMSPDEYKTAFDLDKAEPTSSRPRWSMRKIIANLNSMGYAAASVKTSVRLVKDFAAWLEQQGIDAQSLKITHVTDCLKERWLQRRRRRGDAFTLHEFSLLLRTLDRPLKWTPRSRQ